MRSENGVGRLSDHRERDYPGLDELTCQYRAACMYPWREPGNTDQLSCRYPVERNCPSTSTPGYNPSTHVHRLTIMMFTLNGFICVVALVFSGWALYKGLKSKKEYARLKAATLTPPKQDE